MTTNWIDEKKLSFFIAVFLVLTAIIATLFISYREMEFEEKSYDEEVSQTANILQGYITEWAQNELTRSDNLLDFMLGEKRILESLKKHDAQALKQELLPRFKKVKGNYSQLQFFIPPAKMLVEMNHLESFENDRFIKNSVLLANKKLKKITGIEKTETGVSLILVKPVIYEGKNIGSIVLSRRFDKNFLKKVQKVEKGYYYFYWLDDDTGKDFNKSLSLISSLGPKDNFKITEDELKKCFSGEVVTLGDDDSLDLIILLPVMDENKSVKSFIKAVFVRKHLVEQLRYNELLAISSHVLVVIVINVIVYLLLNKLIISKLRQQNVELERMNKILEESQKKLIELNKQKDRFLSTISHELRTPLNAIIGFTDVMSCEYYGKVNDQQKEYLTLIKQSSKHLLDLINDILQIAKINAGAEKITLENVQIASYVEDIYHLMKSQFEQKEVDFSLETTKNDALVKLDIRKFKQIMLNLLSNALKYTSKGDYAKIKLTIKTESFLVEIIDNGQGVKKEDKDKLFTEFFQSEETYKKALGGTGIGLALTKKLVQVQGGSIGYKPNLEKGSIFWFVLPVKR